MVMDSSHYRHICLDLLENQTWYQPIPIETIDHFMIEFYSLVDEAFHGGVINKTLWECIRTPHPRIPTFYTLPKVHKPGNLKGRQIVSVKLPEPETASTLFNRTLKPHVESLF